MINIASKSHLNFGKQCVAQTPYKLPDSIRLPGYPLSEDVADK